MNDQDQATAVDDPCGSLDPDACEARDTAALAASRAQCDADRAAIVGGQ